GTHERPPAGMAGGWRARLQGSAGRRRPAESGGGDPGFTGQPRACPPVGAIRAATPRQTDPASTPIPQGPGSSASRGSITLAPLSPFQPFGHVRGYRTRVPTPGWIDRDRGGVDGSVGGTAGRPVPALPEAAGRAPLRAAAAAAAAARLGVRRGSRGRAARRRGG